jgi:hypothetical protein
MLTDEHKQKHMGAALPFLEGNHREGDEFLDHISTKIQADMFSCKIMTSVFWDGKGILLTDFLPRGETTNADAYGTTLKKLWRAIQNCRQGLLSSGVSPLHDNARPHTAEKTTKLLEKFG